MRDEDSALLRRLTDEFVALSRNLSVVNAALQAHVKDTAEKKSALQDRIEKLEYEITKSSGTIVRLKGRGILNCKKGWQGRRIFCRKILKSY